MATKKMKVPAKRPLKDTVLRAERAWRELDLSVTSQADKKRVWDLYAGLTALDDEQAKLKGTIEELIIDFWNPNLRETSEVNPLLRCLMDLILDTVTLKRSDVDEQALRAIARELKKDKTCLKKRPNRPTAKKMRSDVLRKRTSG